MTMQLTMLVLVLVENELQDDKRIERRVDADSCEFPVNFFNDERIFWAAAKNELDKTFSWFEVFDTLRVREFLFSSNLAWSQSPSSPAFARLVDADFLPPVACFLRN